MSNTWADINAVRGKSTANKKLFAVFIGDYVGEPYIMQGESEEAVLKMLADEDYIFEDYYGADTPIVVREFKVTPSLYAYEAIPTFRKVK